MEDEKDRIEKIMQNENMAAATFATEIGIQGSTLSHILNGRNKPSLDVLKKILNRFRTINSDWLILGVGSMYRNEKQSQTLNLFDFTDENSNKSTIYAEKKADILSSNQDINQNESVKKIQQPSIEKEIEPKISNEPKSAPSKTVNKIIVYYSDNTYQEFESK